jgi:hypothetical protein
MILKSEHLYDVFCYRDLNPGQTFQTITKLNLEEKRKDAVWMEACPTVETIVNTVCTTKLFTNQFSFINIEIY